MCGFAITSLQDDAGGHLIAGYEREKRRFFPVPYDKLPVHYPGTGDVFASVLTGHLTLGHSLAEAVHFANYFTTQAVNLTFAAGSVPREGVIFEKALGLLIGNE